MCRYFLNISRTFLEYRDNSGHYNRDEKFSYRYIPTDN